MTLAEERERYFPSQSFVVLTIDQFVGRGGGPLERQKQDSHGNLSTACGAASVGEYKRLECLATGLDASMSFPSTLRRCSRNRSAGRLSVSSM